MAAWWSLHYLNYDPPACEGRDANSTSVQKAFQIAGSQGYSHLTIIRAKLVLNYSALCVSVLYWGLMISSVFCSSICPRIGAFLQIANATKITLKCSSTKLIWDMCHLLLSLIIFVCFEVAMGLFAKCWTRTVSWREPRNLARHLITTPSHWFPLDGIFSWEFPRRSYILISPWSSSVCWALSSTTFFDYFLRESYGKTRVSSAVCQTFAISGSRNISWSSARYCTSWVKTLIDLLIVNFEK